jgi:hypothetical protein
MRQHACKPCRHALELAEACLDPSIELHGRALFETPVEVHMRAAGQARVEPEPHRLVLVEDERAREIGERFAIQRRGLDAGVQSERNREARQTPFIRQTREALLERLRRLRFCRVGQQTVDIDLLGAQIDAGFWRRRKIQFGHAGRRHAMVFIAETQIERSHRGLAVGDTQRAGEMPRDRNLACLGRAMPKAGKSRIAGEARCDAAVSSAVKRQRAVEIGARMRLAFVDDQFQPQAVALALAGRKAEAGFLSDDHAASIALEGAGQRTGFGIEIEMIQGQCVCLGRIVDFYSAVFYDDPLETRLAGEAPRLRRAQSAVGALEQFEMRAAQARLDEIDLAAQQRRNGDFEQDILGRETCGGGLIQNFDLLKMQIGRRQELEIEAAANADRFAERLRKTRFDQAALGVPIDEIRRCQSDAEAED